jgi:hypothetical protein
VSRLARIATFVLATLLVAPAAASARTERTFGYQADKVWPTAVRFIRVDEGAKITEKDAEAGYVMFELVDDGKTYSGALELVVADDETGPRVTIVIRIEDRPAYLEAGMLTRLEKKIRADLGSAPARKPPPEKKKPAPPEKKKPDGGDPPPEGGGDGGGDGDAPKKP